MTLTTHKRRPERFRRISLLFVWVLWVGACPCIFGADNLPVELEEGLSRSGYYHIRDFYFDPSMTPYPSQEGIASNDHLFNVMPLYLGLFDTEGRVRAAYYAFKILSLMKGGKLAMAGTGTEVKGFAARSKESVHVVFWNFPEGKGKTYEVSVRFPHEKTGSFQLIRLDPESPTNNPKMIRNESVRNLERDPLQVALRPYEIYWVEISR